MQNESTHPMGERVLLAIEKRGVQPKPSWHFLVHEGVVWAVALFALVVGSIASALTWYISDASYMIEQHIVSSNLRVLFEKLPLIWIVLLITGVGYTVHAIHTTKRGYRWPTTSLVGVAVVVSVAVGWSVYRAGFGEVIDRYLLAKLPLYQPVSGFYPEHWMARNGDMVVGVVEMVRDDGFVLHTIHGGVTEVRILATTDIPHSVRIEEGFHVKVFGTTTCAGGELFEATSVRPYRGRGGMHMSTTPYKKLPHEEVFIEIPYETERN